MPVPASAAIASDIGHGALGLRDLLRPLTELLEASAGQRHLWIEARAGKLLTGWAAHNTTGTWAVPVAETFDGVRRDVVGVRCGTETPSRAQTLATCEATEGTFFYDPEAPGQAERWDDGVTVFDSSAEWDQDPILYVHRLGGRPPTEVDVLAQLGIYWGSHGVWQPTLSATILDNGGFEAGLGGLWVSPISVGAGPSSFGAFADGADKAEGLYSCRLEGTLNAGGGAGIGQVALSGVGAGSYRLSGYYKTPEDLAASIDARFRIGVTGAYLQADGRTTTATDTGITLAKTGGYWRRFVFDFLCPADTSSLEVVFFIFNSGGAPATGSIWFDGLALQRIHRFEFYEPRLTMDGLPPVEQGRPSASAWWGPMQTALGTLSVANGNGLLEQLFATYEWIGAEIVLRVGGRLPDGGNEILADDLLTAFIGISDAPRIRDSSATLSLTDSRTSLLQKIPARRYASGGLRPIAFGLGIANQGVGTDGKVLEQGIVPRLDTTGSNGYGIYDVIDASAWAHGLALWAGFNGRFTSYLTAEAAREGKVSLQRLLSLTPLDGGGPEYSFDIQSGRLTILRDVQVAQITAANNCADFNIGGGPLVAKLALDGFAGTGGTGLRTLRIIGVLDLAQAMSAAAGTAIVVSYSESTHRFTVSKASGTLQLLCNSGANKGTSIWPLLGFDCSSDKTGALAYTAANPVFVNTDQHVIRCGVHGFADDAAGSYTGTAGELIEQPADCLHFVLRAFAGLPAERINAPSFVAARAAGPDYIGVLLTEEMLIADLVSWIEAAIGADLQLDGGVYYLRVRDTSVPSDVLALQDRDYLAFESWYDAQDYAPKIRMHYHFNAEDGDRWAREADVPAAAVRYGTTETLEVATAMFDGTPTDQREARLAAIVAEAGMKRRRFSVTVPGRALILPVGAKVALTRARGLSTTGALSSVLCRIVTKRDSWAQWTSELQLIEVV